MTRKACFFTGTRAEYGLLKPLIDEIGADPGFKSQILVSGSHLSPEFGLTHRQIEADGLVINEKVEMVLSSDSPTGTVKSMGLGMIGYADALERLRPDMIIVLGDRYEAFCVAAAALVFRIPIVHLHGGELTEGAYDDAFRHSITKMSSLHFTATEEYRRRVIQLGEEPRRVFNVGAIGIDNIRSTKLLDRDVLSAELGIPADFPLILATIHPETANPEATHNLVRETLAGIEETPGVFTVFTGSNYDTGGRTINEAIERYTSAHPESARLFSSLGQLRYLSLMSASRVVIGNSSSGIIEAPSLGVPTVNVGERQKGRTRAASVIDCLPDRTAIISALKRALEPDFLAEASRYPNPYGSGGTALAIRGILKRNIGLLQMQKSFYKPEWSQ